MRRVHGMTAAPEAEMPADPVGDRPRQAAGQGVVADLSERGEEPGGGMLDHPGMLFR